MLHSGFLSFELVSIFCHRISSRYYIIFSCHVSLDFSWEFTFYYVHNIMFSFFKMVDVLDIHMSKSRVHVSFQTMFSSGYISRSGIAGSYYSSIFCCCFLRNCHTVLHNYYTVYIPTDSTRGFLGGFCKKKKKRNGGYRCISINVVGKR